MSKDKIMGIIRHVLTFGGGFLVSFGLVDDANAWAEISGAVVAAVGGIWSIIEKAKYKKQAGN